MFNESESSLSVRDLLMYRRIYLLGLVGVIEGNYLTLSAVEKLSINAMMAMVKVIDNQLL